VLTYAVPIALGTDVTIEGRFPMSETEWNQFMAVLAAMKPALVGNHDLHQSDAAPSE
jgi:hypothetical protein